MKSIKNLLGLMRGNGLIYIFAMASVFLANIASLTVPLVIQYTIDGIIGGKSVAAQWWLPKLTGKTLLGACILILILTLFRGIFIFTKGWLSSLAAEKIARDLKNSIMEHLQHVTYNFYSTHDTGDLIQRGTSDVETIRKFLAVQVVEVFNIVMIVGIIAVMMVSLSLKMAFVAMALIPIIVVLSFWFFFNVRKKFKVCDEAEASLSSVLQENLNGIKVVKAFGREPYELGRFENVNEDLRGKVRNLIQNFAYFWSISDFLCVTQIAMVVVFGTLWCIRGEMTIGVVFAFLTYEGMLLFPIRILGRVLSEFGKSLVSVDRIQEILDTPLDYNEDGDLEPEIQGNIVFEDVSFAYDDSRGILKNVSFAVNAGETIGILGPTGSGKSTIGYLLTRLYEINEGKILIDGVPIQDIKKKYLRGKIGLILQETFLYAKSIKENISIRHEELGEEDIVQASKIATLHHNILEFDEQYETMVGEKGVSLSGGQRQRVAIARTIVKHMPVMFFDDSLSAVDTETDMMIRSALKKLFGKTTTFIVSHRINTLGETDRVLVIENGGVTAFDTPENLMKQDGLYKRIWDIQNLVITEDYSA